ncbi:hypothetical protein [Salinisphaera sp. Q1T1-3]|uniref:hypothetical protein n=1 Tax=Salinisphaera sp. Q1T1-3 TaxID=2321229 RepID=UPI000E76AD9E|nr:hypothetical protein [Salinisphaera sp. Q1T1-3]RJS93739.1 hypothetical protein D3260_06630 [Salinisphaera sp. Q1T1-3]
MFTSRNRGSRSRLIGDIYDVLRAASPTHLHLRSRLTKAVIVTLLVDLVGSTLMFLVEHDAPASQMHSPWDAFYWTTSQLVTISSTMPNPVTAFGQLICLVINIYAITVVSTLAGMFSAFFYSRSAEHRRS